MIVMDQGVSGAPCEQVLGAQFALVFHFKGGGGGGFVGQGGNGGAHRDRTEGDGVAGTDGGDARGSEGDAPGRSGRTRSA
jgi:hypothetical protein